MDKQKLSALEARALREIMDGIERRRERRKQAHDVVYLVVGIPRPQLVVAKLVDLSSGGFRAVHDHMRLAAGDAVQYFQSSTSGSAVVVWSRILDGAVESGFQILESRETPEPRAKPSVRGKKG
jgi:hypothetical protein